MARLAQAFLHYADHPCHSIRPSIVRANVLHAFFYFLAALFLMVQPKFYLPIKIIDVLRFVSSARNQEPFRFWVQQESSTAGRFRCSVRMISRDSCKNVVTDRYATTRIEIVEPMAAESSDVLESVAVGFLQELHELLSEGILAVIFACANEANITAIHVPWLAAMTVNF